MWHFRGEWSWKRSLIGVMAYKTIFNNISRISWRSVLLVEETGVRGRNHRPVGSHWQTLLHNIVSSTPRHERGSSNSHEAKVRVAVFNAVLWRSILMAEETGVPGENHRPVASHRQTIMCKMRVKLTMLRWLVMLEEYSQTNILLYGDWEKCTICKLIIVFCVNESCESSHGQRRSTTNMTYHKGWLLTFAPSNIDQNLIRVDE
jgi:hypothetical protein